jgi:hypothetical protein
MALALAPLRAFSDRHTDRVAHDAIGSSSCGQPPGMESARRP